MTPCAVHALANNQIREIASFIFSGHMFGYNVHVIFIGFTAVINIFSIA